MCSDSGDGGGGEGGVHGECVKYFLNVELNNC